LCGDSEEENSLKTELPFPFRNETFRLVLGILTAVIGILKLLSPVDGRAPVVGDLIPALAGLGAGFFVLLGYYRNQSSLKDMDSKFTGTALRNRKAMGFAALGAALLHFLFPQAFLL
jgi:TctA family transporter